MLTDTIHLSIVRVSLTVCAQVELRITPNHLIFKDSVSAPVLAKDLKRGDRVLVRSQDQHGVAMESAEIEFITYVTASAAYSPIT